MIVVRGKKLEEVSAADVAARVDSHQRVVVDLGTGDGRYCYRYADTHPGALVIGIDTNADNLAEVARRAARSPRRGGLANLLFVRASAEDPPMELRGLADEIHVVLPWGRLMVGCLLAEDDVMKGLVSLAGPGARLRLVFNAEIWVDSTPKELAELPRLTRPYVEQTLAPAYHRLGIEVEQCRLMDHDEIAELETTWAKRLSEGRHPEFVLVEARVAG